MSNSKNRMIVFASILGAILATGLLVLNPSPIIISAGGQMYEDQYGYDNNNNNHKTKKISDVNIQKINCVNSNINVNGIDITQIPEGPNDLTTAETRNEDGAAANTQNGNGLGDRINFDKNLVNVCVNANDNEQKVGPPETTLSVKKTIKCTPNAGDEVSVEACQRITTEILPEYFTIFVTGNDANPDNFVGSTVPQIVNLDPGDYEVSETRDESQVDRIRAQIEQEVGILLDGPAPQYSGDCRQSGSTGIGTIEEGESQVCILANAFAPT